MSDTENFVARWARLKRETAREKTQADTDQAQPQPGDAQLAPAAEGGNETALPKSGAPPEPAFDPASLPSIESITADSDIRAFLQSGVPAELTKAALRRVWTTDPAIRDFIGIAENQWDFTDPTAMPGFGPLEATDNVRELVAQAMGKLGNAAEPAAEAASLPGQGSPQAASAVTARSPEPRSQVAGMPEGNEHPVEASDSVEECNKTVFVAPQHVEAPAEAEPNTNRRTHGSALPG